MCQDSNDALFARRSDDTINEALAMAAILTAGSPVNNDSSDSSSTVSSGGGGDFGGGGSSGDW